MLPTELLSFNVEAGLFKPRQLRRNERTLQLAATLIDLHRQHLGQPRHVLREHLAALEEGRTDWKVARGLTHLITSGHATYETRAPTEPALIRQRVFELAQAHPPARHRRAQILEQAARELGAGDPEEILSGLYADLPENQILTDLDPPDPGALIDRYNLAQAQGALYRAYELIITARRNEPARYKQLFTYLKLFGLMVTAEGDPDHGFTLTVDGPTSVLGASTRYGLAMAKFLPALLHVTKWDLTATLKPRRDLAWLQDDEQEWRYELTSEDGLISHYPPPADHDSALEAAFAQRWAKLSTPWTLQREVDLVPVPGGVIIPDFRLVHEDGRSVLLEIVGYWRPEYLRKKFDLLRKSGRSDVIIAVSERLNLDRAGVNPAHHPGILMFKGALSPKEVLTAAELLAVPPVH